MTRNKKVKPSFSRVIDRITPVFEGYIKETLYKGRTLYSGVAPTQIGMGKKWVSYMSSHNIHYGNLFFGQSNKVMHYVNGGVTNGV